jgi:CheY-like chemotaxis protein/DNA-binding transcriptional ArsR family regulator
VRVLVVDDDAVFREELATLLSDWGHQAEPISSGPKALEALEANEVDAIFSDIRMPRLNGIELLRQVRERWPRVYVVMVTGYATVETAVEAMKLGAFDYLRKPFRTEDVQKILALIDEQRAFTTGATATSEPRPLAERWAKDGYSVMWVGAPPGTNLPGVATVEPPAGNTSVGVRGTVVAFVESHAKPGVILTGVEGLFSLHRTEEAAHFIGDLVQEVQAKGRIAVGFEPARLSGDAVLALRTSISAARVHGALAAIANPLRRRILRRLSEGGTTFTEVMRAAGIEDSPKLSFHLRTLQDEGLISHASGDYQLTDGGREAVRVLSEAERLGASDSSRSFLFAIAPDHPSTKTGPRRRS